MRFDCRALVSPGREPAATCYCDGDRERELSPLLGVIFRDGFLYFPFFSVYHFRVKPPIIFGKMFSYIRIGFCLGRKVGLGADPQQSALGVIRESRPEWRCGLIEGCVVGLDWLIGRWARLIAVGWVVGVRAALTPAGRFGCGCGPVPVCAVLRVRRCALDFCYSQPRLRNSFGPDRANFSLANKFEKVKTYTKKKSPSELSFF